MGMPLPCWGIMVYKGPFGPRCKQLKEDGSCPGRRRAGASARWYVVVPRGSPEIHVHSAPPKRGLAGCWKASVVDKVGDRSYTLGVGSEQNG
jgi:hypothetical protein